MFSLKGGRVYESTYEVQYKWRITEYGASVERHPHLLEDKPTRRMDIIRRFRISEHR